MDKNKAFNRFIHLVPILYDEMSITHIPLLLCLGSNSIVAYKDLPNIVSVGRRSRTSMQRGQALLTSLIWVQISGRNYGR
jgi:hypothetical protein